MEVITMIWALLAAPAAAQEICDPEQGQVDLGVIYEDVTDEAGVRGLANSLGANLNDIDGDGDIDIYSLAGPSRIEEAVYYNGESLLYVNNGDLTFTEQASEHGLDDLCEDRAVMFGDLDNDLDPDLYLTVNGGNLSFRNHGDGVFENVTPFRGAADHGGWGHQGFLFDYDRDGWLDVFFTNGPEDGSGFNALLHNEGDGVFRETTWEAGVAGDPSGKGSCVLDVNGDDWPDIFVATGREFGNHLFVNQGDGTFRDEALEWGISDPFQRFGIGPSCADFDNDGDPEIFLVTHDKWWSGNNFFVNMGDHFVDMADESGLEDYLDGHGNAWADVDLDGYLDLILSGIGTPPYVLLNNGDLTFSEVCFGGGVYQQNSLTWAVVPGDLTGDGYPELYITNGLGRRPAENLLFRAIGDFGNHFLTVQVQGLTHNPSQLGAKVEVTADGMTQTRWVGTWTSFDSQGPLPVTFGLGAAELAEEVVVTFTDGSVVSLTDVEADQHIVVTEDVDWEDADRDGVIDDWDACPETRGDQPTDGEGCAVEQRAGLSVGLVAPMIGEILAEPPVFRWRAEGARSAVVELSVDGTFGPSGLHTFGPVVAPTGNWECPEPVTYGPDGAVEPADPCPAVNYALSELEWQDVLEETDGTKALAWRVVAEGPEGSQGRSDPRSMYGALPQQDMVVPEGSNRFVPAHIVVDSGAEVVITNDAVETGNLQNEPHDVQLISPDGRVLSDKVDLEGGSQFRWTFDEPGRYNLLCHRHAGVGTHGDQLVETNVQSHGHTTTAYHCMAGTVTVR